MATTRTPLRLRTDDDVVIGAELAVPDGAVAGAVIAHPHPLYGGSMHAGLVPVLFETLPRHGVAALRFDFRGVGASGGAHGGGPAERADVTAALAALADHVPDVPVWCTGWSFGAEVGLAVDGAQAGWIAVAAPLALLAAELLVAADDGRPVHLLVPEYDQFSSPQRTRTMTAGWAAASVEVIPSTDHFLAGRTAEVADRVVAIATASVG